MIEQFHDIVIKEDAEGNPVFVNYRWRVNHPEPNYSYDMRKSNQAERQQWCIDNLGTGPHGPTWRAGYDYSVFVNLEDAMMFQMVWG